MAVSESNKDLVFKIESLNIDREDEEASLVEVTSDYFSVSTSVHRLVTQDDWKRSKFNSGYLLQKVQVLIISQLYCDSFIVF
jgi:hypothetical protein